MCVQLFRLDITVLGTWYYNAVLKEHQNYFYYAGKFIVFGIKLGALHLLSNRGMTEFHGDRKNSKNSGNKTL